MENAPSNSWFHEGKKKMFVCFLIASSSLSKVISNKQVNATPCPHKDVCAHACVLYVDALDSGTDTQMLERNSSMGLFDKC